MKLLGFLHVNIRCAPEDLPAIELFYEQVVGLRSGFRPNFSFPGLWLYAGKDPIVHVQARYPQGSLVRDGHNSSFDHVAWHVSGSRAFRERLQRLDIPFQEQHVRDAGYQFFLYDPVGTKHEFNFMDEEIHQAVQVGTELAGPSHGHQTTET